MGMLQRVKEGKFLEATLDMALPEEQGHWLTESGTECELLGRGLLSFSPAYSSSQDEQPKDIVLSSGVHGDETSPIELLQRLVEQILSGEIKPAHRLLVIIGHPEAINRHRRYVDENMNRLFKAENPATNPDCIRANTLQSAVKSFFQQGEKHQQSRWHLDLHCAIRDSEHYTFAVSPFSSHQTRQRDLFAFLQRSDIEAALLSNSPSPTFSWYSAEFFGAQALTLELGKVAPFGQNDLQRLSSFYQAIVELVTHLSPNYQWQQDKLTVYKVTRTLIKQSEHFMLNFPDDQANFTMYPQGTLLGRDRDLEYYVLEDGEAVVFPNANVAIGQRACLLVQQAKVLVGEQIVAQ
ncbi:succinylglutamate desuccinylase [Photobacterium gaetbulicola]|nr:succinylglutamate desuccinylase [Photobacterium gaetbulicola]